jgi:alpha-tubulin suppressor-like RCC1 family protein
MKQYISVSVIALLIGCSEPVIGGSPPGRIIGWGYNVSGDIFGSPTNSDSIGYVRVGGHELTNVVAIAAEGLHAMALKGDGTVVAWGWDENKRLVTVPSGLSNVTAISLAGDHNLALKADGTVVAWGYDTNAAWYDPATVVPDGVSNVVAISGGGIGTLVLKRDGTIERWGGEAGAPPQGLSNIVAIAENGGDISDDLALRKDGTIVAWRSLYTAVNGPFPIPPGLSNNVVAVATGYTHCLALKKDGTVAAWGSAHGGFMHPDYGQLNVPAGLSNVVAIAGGPAISLALKKDGTVTVWGDNHHHQIDLAAGLSNIVAIAAGYDFCLAIQTNGTLPYAKIPAPSPK